MKKALASLLMKNVETLLAMRAFWAALVLDNLSICTQA